MEVRREPSRFRRYDIGWALVYNKNVENHSRAWLVSVVWRASSRHERAKSEGYSASAALTRLVCSDSSAAKCQHLAGRRGCTISCGGPTGALQTLAFARAALPRSLSLFPHASLIMRRPRRAASLVNNCLVKPLALLSQHSISLRCPRKKLPLVLG